MICLVIAGLKQVFGQPKYVLLASITSLIVFVSVTWLSNISLVWQIATSGQISLLDKIKVLVALIQSIETNFTTLSALSVVAVAVLFGANLSLVTFYFSTRRRLAMQAGRSSAVASLGGLASGVLGIGCAACGTFALSPALSLVGAGGLIGLLPFAGEEFSALGIGMLFWSLVSTARKIGAPAECTLIYTLEG